MRSARATLALPFLLCLLPAAASAGPCVLCSGPLGQATVGWWDERPLSDASRLALDPAIDVDSWAGSPRIAIVWEDRTFGAGDIWLALSDDGGCTFSSRAVTTGPQNDHSADVAISAQRGIVAIAFLRDLGTPEVIVSADGGASFSPPETLGGLSSGTTTRIRIAGIELGAAFHLHAAWVEQVQLRVARSLSGGSPGSWTPGPWLGSLTGIASVSGVDLEADSRSADPATLSGVTLGLTAVATGRRVAEAFTLRSGDAGATFYGDPTVPASRDTPRRVSDPRADDPALGVSRPFLDGSDDGTGVFYVWTPFAWSDARAGSALAGGYVDARAEEGTTPSIVADWNDPPAASDVPCGEPAPAVAAGLSVIPNPLGRPPAPELHVFTWLAPQTPPAVAQEIYASRGVLDPAAVPTVSLFCAPYPLTGIFPPRPGGWVLADTFAVDEDLSHVYTVWSDTRDSPIRVWMKRTDTQTAAPTSPAVQPGSCTTGGGLLVSWIPPPAPPHCDVAFTRVEWGTSPGVYTASTSVAAGTSSVTLGGLVAGTTYYVRATTVDEACNEASAFEVSGVAPDCTGGGPLCPAPVGNTLLAARTLAGDGALVWTPPPVDALHGPATGYDVYRADVRAQDGYRLLATVSSPAYLDPGVGAASVPPRLFYRIVARNACGTSGDEPPP